MNAHDAIAPCPVCGAALEAGAAFCGSCGSRVTAPAATGTSPAHGGAGLAGAGGVEPGTGGGVGGGVVGAGLVGGAGVGGAGLRVAADGPGWSLGADVDDVVAPVWRRLVALLVDEALAAAVGGAGLAAVLPRVRESGPGALLVPGLLLLMLGAGQWFAEAFAGRTVGGALLGIRTASARTGRAPGLWAVLVRGVVQALGVLLAGVGVYVVAASGAWDEGPERRGWHDKVAGTLVLRARAPRRPTAAAPETPGAAADPPVPTPGTASAASTPSEAGRGSQAAPAAGAAAGSVPGTAAAAAPGDLPDATIPTAGLGDLEHTHVGRWAGALDAAPSTLTLELSTGVRVAVTGPGLIGRRPVPGDEQWAHLVTVDDPEQSVSSTHLAFWPVEGGLDVVDRGSTNGTVLLDPAGKPWSLAPGTPARVGVGWTLVLGNRRIAVARA